MADDNAAKEIKEEVVAKELSSGSAKKQPITLVILAVVNIIALLSIGYFVYTAKMADEAKPNTDDVIAAEMEAAQNGEADSKGHLIPLETFLVNLSGSRGRKLVKINMELEVIGSGSQGEIEKLKPKIRDMIIIILSSKSYSQISTREGKDGLRAEIRNQVNLFLTKGQISRVFFTEFIYN